MRTEEEIREVLTQVRDKFERVAREINDLIRRTGDTHPGLESWASDLSLVEKTLLWVLGETDTDAFLQLL